MTRLGKYTIVQRLRFDNPAFAQYLVYIGERLIGKSFSVPDLGCCQWLEHGAIYATESAKLPRHSLGLRTTQKKP